MAVSMVRPQYLHHNLSEEILYWFDIQFPPSTFHGRLQIGRRKNDGYGVQKLFMGERDAVRDFLKDMHISGKLDYYIMANMVSGVERKVDGLFSLHNIVIDIDCHVEDVNLYWTREVLERLLFHLEHDRGDRVPSPTSIVWTGRGAQLWWAIKPVHMKCRPFYDEVKDFYIGELKDLIAEYGEHDEDFQDFQVDATSSKNVVGYFRLPGSVNTTVDAEVELKFCKEDGPYILQDLVSQMKECKKEDASYKRRLNKDAANAPPEPQDFSGQYLDSDIYILRNYHTFGFFRMRQLIQLRILRDNQVGEETRNNFCFIAYNAMLPALGHERAWDKLVAFNKGFKTPMEEKELERVIVSAKEKNGYRYTNEKMVEFLSITPEEQMKIGLYSPIGPFEPMTRLSTHPSRQQSRKLAKDDRNRKILSMSADGQTGKAIAQQLGISEDTVTTTLRAAGVSPKEKRDEKAIQLLKDGKSEQEIALELGCSARTVRRIFSKNRSGQKSEK